MENANNKKAANAVALTALFIHNKMTLENEGLFYTIKQLLCFLLYIG